MTYKLIRAINGDSELIFDIKKRSIKPYVEKMFGWDEEWQRQFVYKNYKPQDIEFIIAEDHCIGLLEVQEYDDEIFLKNILIVNEYQEKGIGTAILKQLIERAGELHKPIRLEVLAINERAEAFYKRLGFAVTERNNIKVCMEFKIQK
ncbi:GNAT family N-acetyltransferase [Pinibacter soli]|uniref:GNAT family N-acetyltransferase n=1 Tax=Pinibacter soli TaxID=3044211 RepID=A0ABT6R9E3_9BACT|nr:GNAT family N-acetyltransferase [Pinibacter soli]MDI3319178.1 GNAT family N-acetyltransferase [Pinibacter soli]